MSTPEEANATAILDRWLNAPIEPYIPERFLGEIERFEAERIESHRGANVEMYEGIRDASPESLENGIGDGDPPIEELRHQVVNVFTRISALHPTEAKELPSAEIINKLNVNDLLALYTRGIRHMINLFAVDSSQGKSLVDPQQEITIWGKTRLAWQWLAIGSEHESQHTGSNNQLRFFQKLLGHLTPVRAPTFTKLWGPGRVSK